MLVDFKKEELEFLDECLVLAKMKFEDNIMEQDLHKNVKKYTEKIYIPKIKQFREMRKKIDEILKNKGYI